MRCPPRSATDSRWTGAWVSAGAWAYPALALAAGNQGELPAGAWIRPTIVLAIVGALLFLPAAARSGSAIRSAMATALASFWVFHFWNVTQVFRDWTPLLASDPRKGMALCLIPWVFGLGLTLAAALRWRRPPVALLPGLGFAMAILLVQPMLRLVRPSGGVVDGKVYRGPRAPRGLDRNPAVVRPELPDIYLVVLDAYGRDDALERYLGIDNRNFVRQLERRGFAVARHSQANYNQTLLALTSLLNGVYVQDLPIPSGSQEVIAVAPWIRNGRLVGTMRAMGYRIVNIPSATTITEIGTADWIVTDPDPGRRGILNPLEELLLSRTPWALAPRREFGEADYHRNAIDFAFDSLPEVSSEPWPKFVFAHLLVPHPPFLFDANGNPMDSPTVVGALEDGSDLLRHLSVGEYRSRYGAQLAYTNRRVLTAVDAIRAKATRPSVIVLMGDHGSRIKTDFRSFQKTDPGESSRILLAVSMPGLTDSERLKIDGLSPVNVLRFVLGARFGEHLPLLPNRGWYSTYSEALRFQPVPDASARLDAPSR